MVDTGAMSETEAGHADETVDVHATDDGHHDAAEAEPLGPIDRQAWAAAIIGGSIGVVLVIVMLVTIGDL